MKKISTLLLSISILLLMSGCMKKPAATLTADNTNSGLNEIISLTSTSENANAYLWEVYQTPISEGILTKNIIRVSGGEACDNKFSFKITKSGSYIIRLTAYNRSGGCSTTDGTSKYDVKDYSISVY